MFLTHYYLHSHWHFPSVSPGAKGIMWSQKWCGRSMLVLRQPFTAPPSSSEPSPVCHWVCLSVSLGILEPWRHHFHVLIQLCSYDLHEITCDGCYYSVLSELTCCVHITFLTLIPCNINCPLVNRLHHLVRHISVHSLCTKYNEVTKVGSVLLVVTPWNKLRYDFKKQIK